MIEDEPQYAPVLKMVLWGEGREAVMHRLQVNGVEGERAEGIYAAARKERVSMIRKEGIKDIAVGIGPTLAAFLVFYKGYQMSEMTGNTPKALMIAGPIGALFGLWKIFQGLLEISFAKTKEGSLSDD